MMAIGNLHALRMDHIMIIGVFRVEAELELLETCQIIDLEYQGRSLH